MKKRGELRKEKERVIEMLTVYAHKRLARGTLSRKRLHRLLYT